MDEETIKLAPCPFCGSAGELAYLDVCETAWVQCSNPACAATVLHIENWNRRAGTPIVKPDEERVILRGIVDNLLHANVRHSNENDRLHQQNRRLLWLLRAIDMRLHTCAVHEVIFDPCGPYHSMALPVVDFRQICRVIVAATAEEPCAAQ